MDRHSPQSRSLRADAERTGTRLAETLTALLGSLPRPTQGPQALADRLGITVVTASRLLRSIAEADPLAVIQKVPGAVPLRRMIDAVNEAGGDSLRVQAAREVVDEFEELIRSHAGHRSAFSAMLSDWLPQGRREFEVRRRQAAYKAVSELKGVSCGLDLATIVVHPSELEGFLDILSIQGSLGIDRIRPDAVVQFGTRAAVAHSKSKSPEGEALRNPTNLQGEPAFDGIHSVRLDEFCSKTPAPIVAKRFGDDIQYTLGQTGFGPESSVDLVIAQVTRSAMAHVDLEEVELPPYFFQVPAAPSRAMLFDLLLHRDVFAAGHPKLDVFDTSTRGPARPGREDREVDLMRVSEEIEDLSSRPSRLRFSNYPRYQELLAHSMKALDWDPEAFRAYRLHMAYPLHGTQMCMGIYPQDR